MTKPQNPFHWRGTVTDPQAFVGRQRQLTNILTRLRQLGCVSLVGERRIGKSSLAYQTCLQAAQQLAPDCRPVYVDLLSARHHTLEGLRIPGQSNHRFRFKVRGDSGRIRSRGGVRRDAG